MPINVFGNSNSIDNNGKKIDTSLYVQKPYLRTNYIESNFEEDFNLKNQKRIINLHDPTKLQDACSKIYVDNIFKNDIEFNDVKLENIKIVKVDCQPAVNEHLTPKRHVDIAIDESPLLKLEPNEILDLDNQDSKKLNSTSTTPKTIVEIPTKSYIDSLKEGNERSGRDLGIDFYDESSDLVKNNQYNDLIENTLTNLDSVTVNINPTSNDELANKKYIVD